MTEFRAYVPNLTAGELSPKMMGQVTFAKYPTGLEKLENCFIWPQGMASRRPGSRFVAEVKDSAKTTRLLSFEFSIEQAYQIEAGDYYFRFYMNGGQIVDGGGQPIEILTPYSAAELADLSYHQSADILYLTHPDHPPYELQRYSHTDWRLVPYSYVDGPYLELNTTPTTITPSGTWGDITLTAVPSGPELVRNGDFSQLQNGGFGIGNYGFGWTFGANWSLANPFALHVAGSTGTLSQLIGTAAAKTYITVFKVTGRTAGSVTLSLGNQAGTPRNSNSTFTEEILTVNTNGLVFTPTADFDGAIDLVSVKEKSTTLNFFSPSHVGSLWRLRHYVSPPARMNNTGYSAGWVVDNIFPSNIMTIMVCTQTGTSGPSAPDTSGYNIGDTFTDGTCKWRICSKPSSASSGFLWGCAKIVSYVSPTVVNATVVNPFGANTATSDWREGCWSYLRGFPRVGTFFENRLFFAGTRYQPQTIWGSATGDYVTHSPYAEDNSALAFTLNSDQVNTIKWISSQKVLLIGTSRGQWHVSSVSGNDAMTPSNINARQETRLTSSNVFVNCDNSVLFWQKYGRAVQEIAYRLETDAYSATPLSVISDHIGRSPVKRMVYLQEPVALLLEVREDGQIAVMTYERQHQVVAWARWKTEGEYLDISAIPGLNREEIWVIVKRHINGQDVQYIEILEDLEIYEGAVEDLFYLDSGLTYSGPPTTSITGLDHLEGEEVVLLVNGAVHPPQTVVNGAVQLDQAATKVQVGLAYAATLIPVRLEFQMPGGTVQGRRKNIVSLILRFYRSFGCQVGEVESRLDDIPFKVMGEAMNEPLTLFTGDKPAGFPGGWNTEGRMIIYHNLPLPMNILALMPKVEVE